MSSAGDESSSRKLGSVLGRSLVSPLNLAVAAGASASALAFHVWPLAALGGLTYAALVAWDMVSPDFWKKSLAGAAPAPQDPKLTLVGIRDKALERAASAIIKARAELAKVVADNPQIAVQVVSVVSSADALETRAKTLVQSADQLCDYLGRTDVGAIQRELEVLKARSQQTRDVATREQYDRTITTREEQLGVIADIGAAVERAFANLTRISATFESLSARVIRMSAMDDEAMTHLSGDMNAELEEMNRDLESFEEVLRHLQPSGATA